MTNNQNILFITHTYTTFQKSQVEGLAKHFNNVFVFVRYKPIAELSKLLPLRYLRLHSKSFSIDLNNKPENVHVIPVPIFYLPLQISYLKLGDRLFKKIDKLIKKLKIKFDIIHAHYFWTSGYVAYKFKEKYQVPYVVTNHSTYQITKYLKRSPKWREKMNQAITNADYIFVVNNFMKEKAQEVTSKNNIEIMPAGFNETIFSPMHKKDARERLGLSNNDRIIINVSSLDSNKNLELFIDGISKALPNNPNIKGFIIGDGSHYSFLQSRIHDLSLENHIKLTGAQPHKNINLWINASDFVTLCSFIEGSPTVMYETLACGRPFLGSAVGGIPEVITSTDYGYTFNPNSLDDYVAKLQLMLESHWDEKKIIEYSIQFSQESLGKKILSVYRSLINPPK